MKRDNDKCRTCRYNAMLMGYNYHRCDYATLNWPRVKLKDFPDGPWRGPHCAAYEPIQATSGSLREEKLRDAINSFAEAKARMDRWNVLTKKRAQNGGLTTDPIRLQIT